MPYREIQLLDEKPSVVLMSTDPAKAGTFESKEEQKPQATTVPVCHKLYLQQKKQPPGLGSLPPRHARLQPLVRLLHRHEPLPSRRVLVWVELARQPAVGRLQLLL